MSDKGIGHVRSRPFGAESGSKGPGVPLPTVLNSSCKASRAGGMKNQLLGSQGGACPPRAGLGGHEWLRRLGVKRAASLLRGHYRDVGRTATARPSCGGREWSGASLDLSPHPRTSGASGDRDRLCWAKRRWHWGVQLHRRENRKGKEHIPATMPDPLTFGHHRIFKIAL